MPRWQMVDCRTWTNFVRAARRRRWTGRRPSSADGRRGSGGFSRRAMRGRVPRELQGEAAMSASQATMQLHWSSRSPFVRKVMLAAHERGLAA